MIPSIEQIVSGLLAGVHTREQAIDWLEQHASGAANDLRDFFANGAMQALIGLPGELQKLVPEGILTIPKRTGVPALAYEYADGMLKARQS
jgi:hypothetical protein